MSTPHPDADMPPPHNEGIVMPETSSAVPTGMADDFGVDTTNHWLDGPALRQQEQANATDQPIPTEADVQAEMTQLFGDHEEPVFEISIPAVQANPTYQALYNTTLSYDHGKEPGLQKEEYECQICYLPINFDQVVLGHTQCTLQTHSNCILEWLTRKPTCPHCQRPLREAAADNTDDEEELVPATLEDWLATVRSIQNEIKRLTGETSGQRMAAPSPTPQDQVDEVEEVGDDQPDMYVLRAANILMQIRDAAQQALSDVQRSRT